MLCVFVLFCFFRLRYLFFLACLQCLRLTLLSPVVCWCGLPLNFLFQLLTFYFQFSFSLDFLHLISFYLQIMNFFLFYYLLGFHKFLFLMDLIISSLRTSNMYIETILKALFCASVYLSKWKGMPTNFIDWKPKC